MKNLQRVALGALATILASGVAYAGPGSATAAARGFAAMQPLHPIAPAASVDKLKKKRPTPLYVRYARQLQSCDNLDRLQSGPFVGLRAYGGGLVNCWPYSPDWLEPYWL